MVRVAPVPFRSDPAQTLHHRPDPITLVDLPHAVCDLDNIADHFQSGNIWKRRRPTDRPVSSSNLEIRMVHCRRKRSDSDLSISKGRRLNILDSKDIWGACLAHHHCSRSHDVSLDLRTAQVERLSQATRFPDAASVQQYAGVAPITKRSAIKSTVHWRYQYPTFRR